MPASSFLSNEPILCLVPSIVISALYFSPVLYTPIKPVVELGLPRLFGVVEEADEEEEGFPRFFWISSRFNRGRLL